MRGPTPLAKPRAPPEDRHMSTQTEARIFGPLYERVTNGIRVAVKPAYLEDQSEPDEGKYLWSYTINIENRSQETVQLISRYWHITDATGRVQEVRGPGVVGAQPVLQPAAHRLGHDGRALSDEKNGGRAVRGRNSGLSARKLA